MKRFKIYYLNSVATHKSSLKLTVIQRYKYNLRSIARCPLGYTKTTETQNMEKDIYNVRILTYYF